MTGNVARVCAWVAVALVCGTAGTADDVKTVKDGVLDEIHLKAATIPAGSGIRMRPFSVEGVDLGTAAEKDAKQTRTDAANAVKTMGPEALAEAFHAAVAEGGMLKAAADEASASVVVEGRFLRIDPGSRAKRYWAGFGAGKSGIQVTGTVKDASGAVLAEFTHTRNSGIGLGGGDYTKFLLDDTRDVGRDIARFLVRWSSGQDLKKKD